MAKGLGAIMAQVAMDTEQTRLAGLKAVACPFCGREMENSGVTYFCYNGPPHEGKCSKLPSLEDVWGSAWDAQGNVVAAVVVNGAPIVEARIVRGGYGLSNLSISAVERDGRELIPQLVEAHGWTYLDEVHHLRTK